MDVGTISLVVVIGLIFLLGIGMPLGFASAVLAVVVLVMKFEPNLLIFDPFSAGAMACLTSRSRNRRRSISLRRKSST